MYQLTSALITLILIKTSFLFPQTMAKKQLTPLLGDSKIYLGICLA